MNVLSIDLDVCFNGHTYHKHTNFDVSPETSWDIIELCKKDDKNIDTELDIKCLQLIVDILVEKCKKAEFRYIEEHDDIIGVMKEFKCDEATVYNMDAHLDIDYGNDNSELTIENWALHGKNMGLIGDYHWICRPFSDTHYNMPMKYSRTCYKDLSIDCLNEIDLVVICTSRHFTPKKYWKSLRNIIEKYIKQEGEE